MTIKSINTQGVIIKIIPNPKVNGRLIILSIFIRSITMPVPTLPTIKRPSPPRKNKRPLTSLLIAVTDLQSR